MNTGTELAERLAEMLGSGPGAAEALELLLGWDEHDDVLGVGPLHEIEDVKLDLLHAYQRLGREASRVLLARVNCLGEPLLCTRFADLAVASLLREAFIDTQVVIALLAKGLDVQAAVVLRQMWELYLRALVVAADEEVANEWESATFATLKGDPTVKRLQRLHERAWSRGLSPSELFRRAARIEASVDWEVDSIGAAQIGDREREMRAVYFGFLSDLAHGGSHMVLKSTVRVDESGAHMDPLSSLGRPTDWGPDLLRHTLWLQERFWRSFLPVATTMDRGDLSPDETRLVVASTVLDGCVRRYYADQMLNGIEWTDDEADDDRQSWPS